MEYIRVKKQHDYKSTVPPKIHILKPDGSIACRVGIVLDCETVTCVDPDMICGRCLSVENIKPIERKENLRAFLVRFIQPTMESCDPERAKESLLEICIELTEELIKYNVKCHLIVDAEYCGNIRGRIALEGKRNIYLKINYKPKRKDRIKFEANTRDYLLLPLEDVFS